MGWEAGDPLNCKQCGGPMENEEKCEYCGTRYKVRKKCKPSYEIGEVKYHGSGLMTTMSCSGVWDGGGWR